jgi:hypothetical protein
MKKLIIKKIMVIRNLMIKKIMAMDSPKLENIFNHFIPVKRMKLIDRYFPCSSKL